MSEIVPIRAFLLEDDPYKAEELTEKVIAAGGIIVASSDRVRPIMRLVESGQLSPDNIDIALLDSEINGVRGGGKEALRFMLEKELARTGFGTDLYPGMYTEPDPNKIVTVGTSTDTDWAMEISSWSDQVGGPLYINWRAPDLNFPVIAAEVRRLKPVGV